MIDERIDVAFISGSRAEWRLVEPMLRAARDDDRLEPHLVLTGSHLSTRHGRTADVVRAAGWEPAACVEILENVDTPAAINRATARAVEGIGAALSGLRPGWAVVTGDRYESFGAAVAATMLGVPLAHVAGGETDVATNQDGNLRNAMTKLAQLHFVANEVAAERVRALGEEPWRVQVVGLPSLDDLLAAPAERSSLEIAGLVPEATPFVLVSFLPVTLHPVQSQQHLRILLEALSSISGMHKVCVLSNADSAGDEHDRMIRHWADGRSDVTLAAALASDQYTAALRHCDCYVGNSSSGVIETPVLGTPSVIVGIRQAGRARAANVIDEIEPTIESLRRAIEKQVDHGPYPNAVSPFGDGHAAPRICDVLARYAGADGLMSKHLVAAEVIT